MSKSFLTYLRESSKPNKVELYNLVKDEPEFLSVFKKIVPEITLEDELEFYRIRDYIIREDGKIDVDGSVNLTGGGFKKIPYVFGKVTGDFTCQDNWLTSLGGCPEEVGGSFLCGFNQLKTLEGSPKTVGGYFSCVHNNTIKFTKEDVKKICKVKGNIYV